MKLLVKSRWLSCLISWVLLIIAPCSYASYDIFLMNNTATALKVTNYCDYSDANGCWANNLATLVPFKREQVLAINYNEGMKIGKSYTLKSQLNIPNSSEVVTFEIKFKGDFIGSYVEAIDALVNNQRQQLVNADRTMGKVLPGKLGEINFTAANGTTYRLYAIAEHDQIPSTQGIDRIYLTLDASLPMQKYQEDNNTLAIASYNIQIFPIYGKIALDLNKVKTRVDYLVNNKRLRSYDVVVFQEVWDKDIRNKIVTKMQGDYPYFYDPLPANDHGLPLNSGLLVLSRYPISKVDFLNYVDFQRLVDDDQFTNKGAVYCQINKGGKLYNIVASHSQSTNSKEAIAIRQQEFQLIHDKLIYENNVSHEQPLILVGDLNTDLYDDAQFSALATILGLDKKWLANYYSMPPKYSYDSQLNLMIAPDHHEQGMYDYIVPLNSYLLPTTSTFQIIPLRGVDAAAMYERSLDAKLYNYGDVELSDHFLVEAFMRY